MFYGSAATICGVAADCKSAPYAVNIGGSTPSAPTIFRARGRLKVRTLAESTNRIGQRFMIVCPHCVMNSDMVAKSAGNAWFDSRLGAQRFRGRTRLWRMRDE